MSVTSGLSPPPINSLKATSTDSYATFASSTKTFTAKRGLDENDPLFQTAMEKLYSAAWRFDKEKDGELMKTLESRKLGKQQFRDILRGRMNCLLTSAEVDHLVPLFDNKGFVDGCEFILLFYRLRYEFRSKLLTKRVQREKQNRTIQMMKQVKKLEEDEQKVLISLTSDTTDQDLNSALEKITFAAYRYDRLMPGAVQLDAFECEQMRPNEFREQLKLVFNIQLSIAELSALVRYLNRNTENPQNENIICGEFLVRFFRMGFKERNRRLKETWELKKRIDDDKERRKKEELLIQEQKNLLKSSSNFTPEEKDAAIKKLKLAAKLYDKSTPGAMGLNAFEVATMLPHEFKEQLKRVFNLNLSPGELGALIHEYDATKSGSIHCQEFIQHFLSTGYSERELEAKEYQQKQKQMEDERLAILEKKKQELATKNALKLNYEYNEEEFQSAIRKLVDAAWRYDKTMPGAANLEAFEAQSMEPHVFKEQLRRAFMMKITPPELGALMDYFDPERTGQIVCEQFLKKFFKTGFDERQRRMSTWRQHEKGMNEIKEKKKVEKLQAAENKVALPPLIEFTESDFQSAYAKLLKGAVKYDKTSPGAVGLDGFEVEFMLPHEFREQLKLVFNIKVTLPEFGALMSIYDKENTGTIICKEFINKFLRMGIEEREKIRNNWRIQQKQKKEKNDLLRDEKEKEKILKAWSEVDFDFDEKDFDKALYKLIMMCYQFEPRLLGPAGWKSFECSSMNPAEFREVIKRTFNTQLTSQELGALINYFDTEGNRTVNCSAFMNAFVTIRVRCEDFKNKPDEKSKLDEYRNQLKSVYYHKMMRQSNVIREFPMRPWRGVDTSSSQREMKITLMKKSSQNVKTVPVLPEEKYKLRMEIGQKLKRLDLSSRIQWKEWEEVNLMIETESKNRLIDTTTSGKEQFDPEMIASVSISPNYSKGLNMDSLQTLNSEDNEMDIFDSICLIRKSFDQLKQTKMKGKQLKVIQSIEEKINLLSADFKLKIVPTKIFSFQDLNELWLCNNSIVTVPSQIADLKNLKVLSLKHNKLHTIPPEVCLLDQLQRLYLGENELSTLPTLLNRMKQLLELDLNHNKFYEFPEMISTLPKLITLNISYNCVQSLPVSLKKLKSLIYLKVEHNRLVSPQPVLSIVSWVMVSGAPQLTTSGPRVEEFSISIEEESEILSTLRNRANQTIASKLRRRKRKSVYDMSL